MEEPKLKAAADRAGVAKGDSMEADSGRRAAPSSTEEAAAAAVAGEVRSRVVIEPLEPGVAMSARMPPLLLLLLPLPPPEVAVNVLIIRSSCCTRARSASYS